MDRELEKIRQKKLKALQEEMNRPPLPDAPIELTDQDIDIAIQDYPRLVVDC